jgi:5-methylcytosine-specific restriction enzyme A
MHQAEIVVPAFRDRLLTDRLPVHALYYWRPDNYSVDRRFGFGFHLNQNSPVLGQIEPGSSVWAMTRNAVGHYVLAAQLVVRAVTRNVPNYRYGRFRVWGDLEASRYFEIDAAPSIEPVVRHLSVTARARHLAQSFQGLRAVKPLSNEDHVMLAAFAADLTELEAAGIYPEDHFEARLLLGEDAREMLLSETDARRAARSRYLYESLDVTRSRRLVERLQDLYSGRCQICRYDPRNRYGRRLCHGHHIHWLSRGGDDDLDNLVLVCPNHHAAVHMDDAPFDYASLQFTYSNGLCEPLRINVHLPVAV